MGFFINNHDVNYRAKYLLFILWPFGSFIYALRSLQSKSSRVIFFMICMVFGLCIECKTDAYDMSRITEIFHSFKDANYHDLKLIISDSFAGIGEKDLYESSLCWIVNKISNNHHVFWMIASSIYSIFYLKSLSYILDDKRFKSTLVGFLIVFMFTLVEPIFAVTGLRFWTAGWIAICCTLKIIIDRKYEYFILLLLTPLIHITYTIYIVLFIVFLMIKGKRKLISGFVLISFILSYSSLDFIKIVGEFSLFPDHLQAMIMSYTSLYHILEFNEEGTGFFWLQQLFDFILKLYYFFMIVILITRGKTDSKIDIQLLNFTLIVFSFSNFMINVPHLGIRYISFSQIILPVCWLRFFGLEKYKWFIYLYPLCSLFYLIRIRLYNYANVLEFDFLYNSLPTMLFNNLILI